MFGKKSHGPGDGAGKKGIKAAPVDDDMDAFDLKESSPAKGGLADMGGGPSMEEILASLEQILEDDADEEFIPAPPMAAEDAEPLTSRGKSRKSAPPVTAAPAKPDKAAPVAEAEAMPASGKGAWKSAPAAAPAAKPPALGAGDLVDEFLTEEIPLDLDGAEFADTGEGEEEDEVLDLLGSELDEAADLLDDEPMDLAGTEVLDEEEDAGEPLDLSGMMEGDAELEEGDAEDEEPLDLAGAEVMDEEDEEPLDLAGRSLLDGLPLSDEEDEEEVSEEMPLDLAALSGDEEEEESEEEAPLDLAALSGDEEEEFEEEMPMDLAALSGGEEEEFEEEVSLDLAALSGGEEEEEAEESGLPLDLSALSGDEEENEESGLPLDLTESDADGEVEVDLSVLLAASAGESPEGDLDVMDGLMDEEMVLEQMPQLASVMRGDGEDGEGLDDEAALGEESESLEEAMEEMDALADMEGDLPVEEEEEEPAPVFQGLSVGIATLQEEPPARRARREGFTEAEVEAAARQLIAEVLAELLPGLVEEEARREMERLKQD